MQAHEWNIPARAIACAQTGKSFSEGEMVYSTLLWKNGHYERVDLCEEAWQQRNDNLQILSSWKMTFELPPPPPPDPLPKDDAETLLRRLMNENDPARKNACYILALMLERKRILKPLDRQSREGNAILVYEHLPSGETWIIPDPHLKLDELTTVQDEVAALMKSEKK